MISTDDQGYVARVNDYDPVAAWYDLYVRIESDLAYFARAARTADRTLDLMAGTGRVSLAMAANSNGPVICVDSSRRMLEELRKKGPAEARIGLVCADVRTLPLRRGFDLCVISFNALGEIVSATDRERVLANVWDVLEPGGAFICTLHNPAVRKQTLDDAERELGAFTLESGERLVVTARGSLDDDAVATSTQRYELRRPDGTVIEEKWQTVRFALVERDEIESVAADRGFERVSLHGDYDSHGFDAATSPFLIWTFRRPRREEK